MGNESKGREEKRENLRRKWEASRREEKKTVAERNWEEENGKRVEGKRKIRRIKKWERKVGRME